MNSTSLDLMIIQDLLNEIADQIQLAESLCERVADHVDLQHRSLSKQKKKRPNNKRRRKIRIFSSSEDDSSSSTSVSDDDNDEPLNPSINEQLIIADSEEDDEQSTLRDRRGPRTKNELSIDDLPPIENLTITLSEETPIELLGYVRHIVDGKLVIIESLLHSKPLSDDTVLFNRDRRSIGLVFETFGPVERPYYSIRYNDLESICQRQIELNQQVYYAPKETTYTKYVFVQELRALKGSDASWEDDNEPPKSAIDYSDDEQERAAKAMQRGKRNFNETNIDTTNESDDSTVVNFPSNISRGFGRGHSRGRGRGFFRSQQNNSSNRPVPSIPNWFQSTSTSQSRPQQSLSTGHFNNDISSAQFPSSSGFQSSNNNLNLQSTQQAVQGNHNTHSVFPWM